MKMNLSSRCSIAALLLSIVCAASGAFAQGAKLAPPAHSPLEKQADAYEAIGKHDQALAFYDKAIADYTTQAKAMDKKGDDNAALVWDMAAGCNLKASKIETDLDIVGPNEFKRTADDLEAAGKHDQAVASYDKAAVGYRAQGKLLETEAAALKAAGKLEASRARWRDVAEVYSMAANASRKSNRILMAQINGTAPAAPPTPTTPRAAAQPAPAPVVPTTPNTATPNPQTAEGRRELFMQLVRQNYEKEVNGTLTRPIKLVVTFHSFDVAAPVVNKATTVGGIVYRVNDAAPVDSLIYPIKTKFSISRTFGDRTTSNEELFWSFDAITARKTTFHKGGEWLVSSKGPVH